MRIAPITDKRLGSVTGSYQSRYGEIKVTWRYAEDGIQMDIAIPMAGELQLPDGRQETLRPGTYYYVCSLQ